MFLPTIFLSESVLFSSGLLLVLVVLVQYVYDILEYYRVTGRARKNELPPRIPTLIPYLGSIIPFLWDTPGYLQRVA
jgi:hypothetical protein